MAFSETDLLSILEIQRARPALSNASCGLQSALSSALLDLAEKTESEAVYKGGYGPVQQYLAEFYVLCE